MHSFLISMNPILIEENRLVYELNMVTFTADVTYSPNARGEIEIPCIIYYQTAYFTVFSILSNAFRKNHAIESIIFPDSSNICIIYGNAFKDSSLKKLFIPQHLEIMYDGWCNETPNLRIVIVSPKNKMFTCVDEKYIIGKSNPSSKCYESLVFASRDIDQLLIPTFIKSIESYSFQNCTKLKSIEFLDESKLKLIRKYAFDSSSICDISLPSKVKIIEDYAFNSCMNLKSINFQNNPESIKIGKLAFLNSSFEGIKSSIEIKDQRINKQTIQKEEQHETSNDLNCFNDDYYKILTDSEKQQINRIIMYYKSFKLSFNKYYSLIIDLIVFIGGNDQKATIERCGLTGIIPSFIETQLKGKSGFILALNEAQLEKIINKSYKSLNNSFLKQNSKLLSNDLLIDISSKNKNKLEVFWSLIRILSKPEIKHNVYSIFLLTPKYSIQKASQHDVFLPNNYIYLKKWQEDNKTKKTLHDYKTELNKCKKIEKQLNELIFIIKEKLFESNDEITSSSIATIDNSSSFAVNDEATTNILDDDEVTVNIVDDDVDDNAISNDSNDDACDKALFQIKKSKELISIAELQSSQKSYSFIDELIDKLYSDKCIEQKQIFRKIIEDVLNHKKYKSWNNSKALEFSFLLKYCSSAAYYRLFVFLNEKIPPPTTVDNHFSQMLSERQKVLTYSDLINELLDQYFIDIETEIQEYILEYGKRFKEDINIENFKITICLGCGAASFTPLNQKRSKEENVLNDNEDENLKKEKKKLKN